MNFYPHHIGDYVSATAHLSMLEDGAYRRLLDAYYTREAPLPAEVAACCRLVRAFSKDERAAVSTVLREYFVETPDGWRHNRCDREIDRAREIGEDGEARRENEKERQRRHRDRRKTLFEQLRGYGVVPPFETSTASLIRLLGDARSRAGHGDGHGPVTRDVTQTQRLTNTNPNPNTNPPQPPDGGTAGDSGSPGPEAASDPPPEPPGGEGGGAGLRLPEPSPGVKLALAARAAGVECTGSDPRLLELAAQGVTVPTLVAAIEEARRTKPRPPLGYVIAVLGSWAQAASKVAVNGAAPPGRGAGVVVAHPSAATVDEATMRRISEQNGGLAVERLPDGRLRCGVRFYRPNGNLEVLS